MTTRHSVTLASMFGVLMMCVTIAWASGNGATIGTTVPDGVADELRAGGNCDYLFTTDNEHPVYCVDVGGQTWVCCYAQIPNSFSSTGGNDGKDTNDCGSAWCCSTYTGEGDCSS